MKKLSVFAIAMAAMVFAACGGNKSAQNTERFSEEFRTGAD